MHKLQVSDYDIPKEAFIWNKLERFMELIPKEFSDNFKQAR